MLVQALFSKTRKKTNTKQEKIPIFLKLKKNKYTKIIKNVIKNEFF